MNVVKGSEDNEIMFINYTTSLSTHGTDTWYYIVILNKNSNLQFTLLCRFTATLGSANTATCWLCIYLKQVRGAVSLQAEWRLSNRINQLLNLKTNIWHKTLHNPNYFASTNWLSFLFSLRMDFVLRLLMIKCKRHLHFLSKINMITRLEKNKLEYSWQVRHCRSIACTQVDVFLLCCSRPFVFAQRSCKQCSWALFWTTNEIPVSPIHGIFLKL